MNAAETAVQLNRRRAILCALLVAPAYMMPVRAVREQIGLAGYAASLDLVRTECAWLAEVGLATWANDVAVLTDRGADVVLGNAQVPGVKRPEAGEA